MYVKVFAYLWQLIPQNIEVTPASLLTDITHKNVARFLCEGCVCLKDRSIKEIFL